MKQKKEWTIVGLMSGTSLDGLDIAICRFKRSKLNWDYSILDATTISYPNSFKKKLESLMFSSAVELSKMDAEFGRFSGEKVLNFIKNKPYKIDCIASHGHTVFHQPNKYFTVQIGSGAHIHAITNLPVVADFRSIDVALKGQGAPLVPIGDQLLFQKYKACINLGGIANISFQRNKKRIAGDICAVNILLNYLAGLLGKPFDKNGSIAQRGIIDKKLFDQLCSNSFYQKPFPKSIGREWIDTEILPIIDQSKISVEDKMATCVEYVAVQIVNQLKQNKITGSVLFTGGGTFNTFLMSRIQYYIKSSNKIIIPEPLLINYKEALIFAFLGLKNINNEINTLKSVTGALKDSIGGALYGKID